MIGLKIGKTGNSAKVTIGRLCIWFSYRTPIAFQVSGLHDFPIVCVNDWGPTTGEHLNAVDGGDKGSRISRELFTSELYRILGERGLN